MWLHCISFEEKEESEECNSICICITMYNYFFFELLCPLSSSCWMATKYAMPLPHESHCTVALARKLSSGYNGHIVVGMDHIVWNVASVIAEDNVTELKIQKMKCKNGNKNEYFCTSEEMVQFLVLL